MRTIKKLIIICMISLIIVAYLSPSLLRLQSDAINNNIGNIKDSIWYSTSIQRIKEMEKSKVLRELQIQIRSTTNDLINNLNKYILKDNKDINLELRNSNDDFSMLDIMIGDSLKKVIETLGEPARKDASRYGFQWYIYNQDYSKYLQVGVHEGKVVGLYTNSLQWQSETDVHIGVSKDRIKTIYGEPLEFFKKGNTIYQLDSSEESHTYLVNNYYITFFFDLHNNSSVTAIQLIDKNIEENFKGFYGTASDDLRISFEKQVFDLANSTRVRFGLPPFEWNDVAAAAARKHSMDMARRSFFEHMNPDGRGPSDRLENEGIAWRKSGENIAAGQTSAIFAHENWMNSIGHRENILGDFKELGVGVYFGGNYSTYYTQKFFTPY